MLAVSERAALAARKLEGSEAWFAEPAPNSSFTEEEFGLTKGTTELFCVSEPAAERGAVGVEERGVGSDRGCEAMAVCMGGESEEREKKKVRERREPEVKATDSDFVFFFPLSRARSTSCSSSASFFPLSLPSETAINNTTTASAKCGCNVFFSLTLYPSLQE